MTQKPARTAQQPADAATAFEDLRREISLQRAAIEGLTAAKDKLPDYSPIGKGGPTYVTTAWHFGNVRSRRSTYPAASLRKIFASARFLCSFLSFEAPHFLRCMRHHLPASKGLLK